MGKLTETIDFLNRTDFQGLSQEKFGKLFYSHIEITEKLKKQRKHLKNSAKKQENNV
jgi:hypothetical protein